jgi:hypothetical protein
MRRNPPILLLRLGEGAAPVISFPSIQLRFTGPRGGHRRFFRPAQKEAADVAQPTAKRQKACHRPFSLKTIKRACPPRANERGAVTSRWIVFEKPGLASWLYTNLIIPRLGSLALPRSPESGVAVSTRAKFLSREKTQNLESFFPPCLYLVVRLRSKVPDSSPCEATTRAKLFLSNFICASSA